MHEPRVTLGPLVEVEIESLAFGGDAVGRQVGGAAAGRVTFVPLAAPGDRVRVALHQEKKTFARGEIRELVRPSDRRVSPPCPYFGRCGGCQWQHVDRDTQLAAKTAIVRRALALPDVNVETVSDPYGYRDRARMVAGRTSDGAVSLCFRARSSHDLVAVDDCRLLSPGLREALPRVRARLDGVAVGTEVAMQAAGARIAVRVGDRPFALAAGQDGEGPIDLASADEPALTIEAGAFAQVGRVANRVLTEAVRELVGSDPGPTLELYAGSGNFTRFLVAQTGEVVATDGDADARRAGQRNVPAAQWLAPVAIPPGKVFDTIVVDPPRAGLDTVALAAAQAARRQLVYVSCDPQTFTRDKKRLEAAGLGLAQVRAFDLMPQTYHVELVARFEREG